MIYETKINLKNKNKEELTGLLNETLEITKKQQAELEKKDRQLEEKTNRIRNLEREAQKYFEENIYLKAKQVSTLDKDISDETKAAIYDNFDKIFYEDTDKKEKIEAILTVEKFNKENRFKDFGKINNAINLVLFLAKENIKKEE